MGLKYSLGLDIGTTSIGWAVIDLENKRIHDVGVRIFEKPEDPQTGKSLAEPRRTARSTRRRLKRRRQRLDSLKEFFVKNNLLTNEEIQKLLNPSNQYNPYEIRAKGIKEKLTNQELFLALYHIAKRRGYKSNRKAVEEKDSEGSRVLSAISDNSLLLTEYPTVGVAMRDHSKFKNHKRNKRDDYSHSFARGNFLDEAKQILEKQKEQGLQLSEDEIDHLLYDNEESGKFNGVFSQRPFMTSELMIKMRGNCELEPTEPRAPRASYSFELFRLAQNLAHLRIAIGNEKINLTEDEILAVIEKAKQVKTLRYSHIREVLGYKKDANFSFPYGVIRGKIKPNDVTGGEGNKFDEMKFYHTVKSSLKEQPEDWSILENNPELFDKVGELLSINKDDVSLQVGLKSLPLSSDGIDSLMKLDFSGFGHLSLNALRKITPHLLRGQTYDKAVELAGYKFTQTLSGNKTKLPPLNEQEAQQLTNPVVKRAVSQTIKVVNAIIRKYGLPTRIGVEAAGELSKNFQERGKIKKMQDDNAANNERIKDKLIELGVAIPTGLQITKYKLYEQQNGQCMYSGRPLDLNQLFADERYGEIDHVVPFSRCGNDGLSNKVLVLSEENQNKGNLTPYEAWGKNSRKWEEFSARVNALFMPFNKKDRLLAKTPPSEEWNIRALNDTRYISKFLRGYLRENLQFADFDDYKGKQKVITPTGPITSYLRRVWRVGNKAREENNLHHATDACIIGSIDQGTIQKVSSLNKYYELFKYNDENEIVDKISGEYLSRGDVEQHIEDIQPWEDFGKEVRIRTALYTSPSELHNELSGLESYDDEFITSVNPIFVSRMPKRSGKGLTNKETIRSPKIVEDYVDSKGNPVVARKQRVPLNSLKLKDLYDSPIRSSDTKLYNILKKRLEDNDNDPKKAFEEPVYKPTKDGSRGNIVRSVKVYDTQNSKTGFYINNGKAFVNNGSTIKLNVYKRKNPAGVDEYYFAPVYAHMVNSDKFEILPTPNGRSAKEKESFDKIRESDGRIYATEKNGFIKQFSVYPNDYLRIYMKNKIVEGYYVKYDISTGSMSLVNHNESGKDNLLHASAKAATTIERMDTSILGDNYKWI